MRELKTRKRWTKAEEQILERELQKKQSKSLSFIITSRATGRSQQAVEQHYYAKKNLDVALSSTPEEEEPARNSMRKWTHEEDEILFRYVKAGVGNLKLCFISVAEQIGRTPCGVAAHWYAVLSKKEGYNAFARVSPDNVLWNRKNGKGERSSLSIWQRILRMFHRL